MRATREGDTLTLHVEGRIDSSNAAAFEREVMAEVDATSASRIVLDASELDYISSAGLRVFLKLGKLSTERLQVTNVSLEVYEVLYMTGFTEFLDVKKRLREISVEGCELIGEGGYGKVYRLDEETIAKIYNPTVGLDLVERERNVSQRAFVMGVPTAISYDVVKCGDCYGVVFEMLDAKTTAQLIEADPTQVPQIAAASARLLKELHEIVPGPDSGLPRRKQIMLEWAESLTPYVTAEEAATLKDFIEAVPERDTFLHGDFNAKNIMVRDGEYQLIDIGDASIGHPVFDIAGLMLAYIILPNSAKGNGSQTPEQLRGFLGFDFEYAQQMWGVMCATYFGLSSPDEIAATTQRLMPYCLLLMCYTAMRRMSGDPKEVAARVDTILRPRVLPAIEHAQPLDF